MPRAISKRCRSASRLIDRLSNVSFILAQVDTWWFLHKCARAHRHTHTHTLSLSLSHTHTISQKYSYLPLWVLPRFTLCIFSCPKTFYLGRQPIPLHWPSFPSSGFVECVFPHDVDEAAWAPSPVLGLLSPREPGLCPPPQHICSTVPRKLAHGSPFSDTSYLFLWDTIEIDVFFFFLLDLVKSHSKESESLVLSDSLQPHGL